MFDTTVVSELAGLVDRLAELPSTGDDGERIDRIAVLEKLKAAVAAAQLGEVAEFATSQEAANKAMGVEARRVRRGIPEQVGLARKVSATAAAHQVSRAKALIEQLPETFDLLRRGEVSEHVAIIVATETSHLAADDRRLVDKQLAAHLAGLSPRRAEAAARRLAIEADPAGAVRRAGKAREDRRVGVRPAPDTMAVLSALLPCEQGVAAFAALRRHADALKSAGDERTRNQIMADTLVERLTGQATAHPAAAEIGLIMTEATLFTDDDTAADLHGYGPIPADLARDIARGGGSQRRPGRGVGTPDEQASTTEPEPTDREARRARVFLRRLFTDPATGIITDCDPRRRRFDGVLAKLLVYRDHTCPDPYCDAPIRHLDHIQTHAAGGPTTSANGRGVCERGSYTRHMPGFSVHVTDPDRHIVATTTPTGHRYRSSPPTYPLRM